MKLVTFDRDVGHRDAGRRDGRERAGALLGGGCGLELERFLEPGDVVELEVEGIGVLRNRLVKLH